MTHRIECRGHQICSPFISSAKPESIFYLSTGTGEVYEWKAKDEHACIVTTGGEAAGATVDDQGCIHIVDTAHAAVLRVDDNNQPGVMVKAYEDKPFHGPNSITFGQDGTLFFTDSGPFGESTLAQPAGSIYCITPSVAGGQVLRPIVSKGLAHPCGITMSRNNPHVGYVAELLCNRILKLSQRPVGIHHTSVFYTFNGGMGPSCIACTSQGELYIGHYNFADDAVTEGKISVLSADGVLHREISIQGTEITGICLSADESMLLVTEASTSSLYQVDL